MKKIFTLLALAALTITIHAGELTVADGTTTNDNLPVYGFYADTGFGTEFIYPAASLANIDGSTINALLFHSAKDAVEFPQGEVTVKLAEVEQTTLSEYLEGESFQKVYQGSFDVVNGKMVFEFSEPYAYGGGNLLVQISLSQLSTKYPSTSFYGISSAGSGFLRFKAGSTNMDYGRDFLPKVTISFAEAAGTCPRPSKLSASVTPDGAVFDWQAEEGAQHQVCVVEKDAEAAGWELLDADVLTYTAKGLTAGKTYDFYVRTFCSESEQSAEVKTSFTPECKAPAEVNLSELTHAAATLSWEAVAGIEKYQFTCVRKDSTPEWESVDAQAVLTVTVDTLAASTSYDFYVRSWFNVETQSAATKLTFTTNCLAEEIPYKETFASSDKPACWTVANWGSSYNYWSIDTYVDHSGDGSYSLKYNARTSSSAQITTASIDLAEDALLNIYYQNRYGSSGSAIKFDVIVLDASNETELLSEGVTTASPDGKWEQKTIDISTQTGKVVKVKIVAYGNGGTATAYLRIDDISITAKPCVTPTNLKAAASTTGAVVTWTAGGDETAWNLRYKAVSAEEWKEIKDLDEPTYTIDGCSPETEYEVQVQAACNGDKQSPWTASALFTPVCPVPTKLAVNVVEDDRALVAWECTESVFNLQYKAADAEEWTTVEAIEAKSYALTDLEASTKYQVKVQTACGSAYTSAVSFTTRCAPLAEAIPYLLHMDSVAVGSMPECWFVLPRTAEVEVTLMNDSTHRLQITGEQECWIVLPALEAELQGLTVSLTWSGMASMEIGYLTAADQETFVVLATTTSGEQTECNLRNASADAKYVAFHYIGTSDYSIAYIAQVQIDESTDETAIYTPATNNQTTHKMLRDGRLIIEHNGILYNAQGQKLQ